MFTLPGSTTEKLPSVINNPFKSDKIKVVSIHWGYYSDEKWHGSVEFKNGDTSGKQELVPGEFNDITRQIKTLIESLK